MKGVLSGQLPLGGESPQLNPLGASGRKARGDLIGGIYLPRQHSEGQCAPTATTLLAESQQARPAVAEVLREKAPITLVPCPLCGK